VTSRSRRAGGTRKSGSADRSSTSFTEPVAVS
jgi:hypothetical protein